MDSATQAGNILAVIHLEDLGELALQFNLGGMKRILSVSIGLALTRMCAQPQISNLSIRSMNRTQARSQTNGDEA